MNLLGSEHFLKYQGGSEGGCFAFGLFLNVVIEYRVLPSIPVHHVNCPRWRFMVGDEAPHLSEPQLGHNIINSSLNHPHQHSFHHP